MKKLLLLAVVLAGIAVPRCANAQLEFLTGLYKDVHGITFYAQGADVNDGKVTGNSDCLLFFSNLGCGAGAEVLIDLTSPGQSSHLELGLGASYTRGFSYAEPDTSVRLAVRSFPTFSAYWTDLDVGPLQGYLGASFGLADLFNVQAYDSANREYSISASTFELGGTGGLYLDLDVFGVFAEYSYRSRRFASLNYTFASAGKDTIPTEFPRSLDFSGSYFSVGIQFDLKPDQPTPAFYPGVWTLARVDAQQLPSLVAAERLDSTRNTRTEIVSGLLTLDPTFVKDTAAYLLELHVRHSTVNAAGQVQTIDSTQMRTESGRYTIDRNKVLVLLPDRLDGRSVTVPPGTGQTVRLDEEIRVRSVIAPFNLVFSKTKAGNRLVEPADEADERQSPQQQ